MTVIWVSATPARFRDCDYDHARADTSMPTIRGRVTLAGIWSEDEDRYPTMVAVAVYCAHALDASSSRTTETECWYES
jgi:hypothetical protein